MPGFNEVADARRPVVVDAVRTPFLNSTGAYAQLHNYQLAALPLAEILRRAGLDAAAVELVTMGMVVQDVETTNVAREAMLVAGYPSHIPAYSISMAGVSPNVGVINLCDAIALGRLKIGVAAGTENFSDLPIRLPRRMRQRAIRLSKARSLRQRLKLLGGIRPADLLPELPSSQDLTTGLSMGSACENMAQRFAVTREAADVYALSSHQRAQAAWDAGHYADVMRVSLAQIEVSRDDAIRGDTSLQRLAALKPSFDPSGIVTPGNASGLTDGAAALLMMAQGEAEQRGLTPLARVCDAQLTGVHDMHSEMLLGPAMAIPPLLARHGLRMQDIAVFELHEAFAAQILANQAALADTRFAREELGLEHAPGAIPAERLNLWGGSLALGNPFAGTGIRLISTAARRLRLEGGRYAVVATCAGGGLGSALLLENPEAV